MWILCSVFVFVFYSEDRGTLLLCPTSERSVSNFICKLTGQGESSALGNRAMVTDSHITQGHEPC